MPYETIAVSLDGPAGLLTVSREASLNALNRRVLEEARAAALELESNQRVRGIILTGAGDKAFVAGADLHELKDASPETGRAFAAAGRQLADTLRAMRVPVVAAVNGPAVGGGCELALACDFIFATERARFGQPEVALGMIPGFGATQRLSRRIGVARATELILTGELISANEACAMGMVNRVYPAAQLLPEAKRCIERIATKSAVAVAAALQAIRKSQEVSLGEGCDFEFELFGNLFATQDLHEGVSAFLERRSPNFTGR